MKFKTQQVILVNLVLAYTIALDQLTKRIAEQLLIGKPTITMLWDTVRLYFVQNSGAFLSLGADFSPALKLILLNILPAIILLTMLIFSFFTSSLNRLSLVMLALMCGGGLSNLMDRIFFNGLVTDFLNVGILRLRTGVFNVADMAIMAGAIGLILFNLKKTKKNESQQKVKTH